MAKSTASRKSLMSSLPCTPIRQRSYIVHGKFRHGCHDFRQRWICVLCIHSATNKSPEILTSSVSRSAEVPMTAFDFANDLVFLLNGREVRLYDVDPTVLLVDHLRSAGVGLTGT